MTWRRHPGLLPANTPLTKVIGSLAITLLTTFTLCADRVTNSTGVFGLGAVTTAAISPDGKHAATGGPSGAFLWDFAAGALRFRFEDHLSPIQTVSFAPDSRVLLTAGKDNLIRAWDTESGAAMRVFTGHTGTINGLAFAPDSRSFASAAGDGTVRIWSLETGEIMQTVEAPHTWMNRVAFAPDGIHFATVEGVGANAVRLWNTSSQTPLRTFEGHVGQVSSMRFLADGTLITGGEDKTVRIWSPDTGQIVKTFGDIDTGIISVDLLADGTNLVAASGAQRIHVWNRVSGEKLREFSLPASVHSLEAVPSSSQIIVAAADNTVRIINVADGTTARTLDGHTDSTVTAVGFSPDEQLVLSGAIEDKVRLWNRKTGVLVRTFDGHPGGTAAAAFSPDGARILTTRGTPQPVAQLWSAASGALEQQFTGHSGWPLAAVFSPDGKLIATSATDNTVRIWNTETGQSLRTLRDHNNWTRALAFSPDGEWLASGSEDLTARIWEVKSGRALHVLEGHDAGIKAVAFLPDGRELMTASEDGMLLFWNPGTGERTREIFVPAGFLNAAVYSPDGEFILTGEGWPFFIARLLDARTGELLRVFARHTGPIGAVSFNPRGFSVLTGGDLVRLWDISDIVARLGVEKSSEGLEVRWRTGVLQQASSVTGPWEDLPLAKSPHQPPAEGAAHFFRVKVPAE